MQQENPLVSIIVITFNSAKYVVETLESAKAQTYQNIELIVSDDYSTDNTVKICTDWMENNKERFVRTKLIIGTNNTGIPANCNRGANAAMGEWLKLIAGDDILLDGCIISNLNYAKENKCKFIFSDTIWFNDHAIINNPDNSEVYIRKQFIEIAKKYQLRFYSRYPVFLNSPTWFISKKIFEMNTFDEDFKILEDQSFVLSYLEKEGSISYLNMDTVKYRKHENSVIHLKGQNFVIDFELCYEKYRKKNLKYSSIIDLLFIVKFKTHLFKIVNSDERFKRYLGSILSKINPITIFNISPSCMLKSKFKKNEKVN